MKATYIHKPSPVMIVMYLLAAIAFAAALGSLLRETSRTEVLNEKRQTVRSRMNQLQQTEATLAAYQMYLAKNPLDFGGPVRLKWEAVEVQWEALPFTELLHRINGMYDVEQTFVLDSFSFDGERGRGAMLSGDSEDAKAPYTLKGYLLCLCQ